jgi:hypothetical protein
MLRYGIKDDEGRVVRWQDHEPKCADYETKEFPDPQRKPVIDWNNFEPALL